MPEVFKKAPSRIEGTDPFASPEKKLNAPTRCLAWILLFVFAFTPLRVSGAPRPVLSVSIVPDGVRLRLVQWRSRELHNRYVLTDVGGVACAMSQCPPRLTMPTVTRVTIFMSLEGQSLDRWCSRTLSSPVLRAGGPGSDARAGWHLGPYRL